MRAYELWSEEDRNKYKTSTEKKVEKALEEAKKENEKRRKERGKAGELEESPERITNETNEKLNQRAKEFNLKQTFNLETPQIPEYLTEEHIKSLNEIFGENNLEFTPVPSPETLDENYIKMMYPEKQTEKDKKRNLVSYRPSWFNEKSDESITKSKETWGESYIRGMKEELKTFKDSTIFIESIQKPKYQDGTQQYGSKDGIDKTKDPLINIFQEVFGKDQNRFNHTHDDLTQKLISKLKERIIKNMKNKNLDINPENMKIILCPASLFNLQTTLNHPENSQTNTWEWTSTILKDKNNQDTGHRLFVGGSGDGGAAYAGNARRGSSWDYGGVRLAVVFNS